MIYYINTDRRRLVGRNNQPAVMLPDLADYTRAELTFSFVDSQNKIVELTELPGAYLAGAVKLGKSSSSLLFFSDDFTIADNQITFVVDLRAKTIADQITKANSEIWIELGAAPAADSQRVLLRDNALISPRVWHEGDGPDVPSVSTYYTKIQTDSLLALKQDLITEDAKLSYQLVSGMPPVPTKVSQLENDSGYQTAGDVEAAVGGKQPLITSEAKLGYDLVSGTPDLTAYQPLITSEAKLDFANVSGVPEYATPADVQAATSGKADSAAVAIALAGKQPLITAEAKIDYALVSGTPAIPTAVSDLTNDSGYQTARDVEAAVSGKLETSAYIEPYKLPAAAGAAASWLASASAAWTDTSIIEDDKKIQIIPWTDQTYMNFPTISAAVDQTNVRTCQIWLKMPGGQATGITSIYTPATYSVIDESGFPAELKGAAASGQTYTYHIFVLRFIPKAAGTYCELNYSHAFNTDGSY